MSGPVNLFIFLDLLFDALISLFTAFVFFGIVFWTWATKTAHHICQKTWSPVRFWIWFQLDVSGTRKVTQIYGRDNVEWFSKKWTAFATKKKLKKKSTRVGLKDYSYQMVSKRNEEKCKLVYFGWEYAMVFTRLASQINNQLFLFCFGNERWQFEKKNEINFLNAKF